MPARGAKNKTALGRALVKSKGVQKRTPTHTQDTGFAVADSVTGASALMSVTEMTSLEDFVAAAAMADKSFAAERGNIAFVDRDTGAMQVVSDAGAAPPSGPGGAVRSTQHLRIPRRPAWDVHTQSADLHTAEKRAFLDWRREIASLEAARAGTVLGGVSTTDVAVTPFEKNLDVWRQLWQVVERSDVLVQILDARNPLLFRCPDLEDYVREVNPMKRCMLLINKADFLSPAQRRAWHKYFALRGILCVFFSAKRERERMEEEDRRNAAAHAAALSKAVEASGVTDVSQLRDEDTGAFRPDLSAGMNGDPAPIEVDEQTTMTGASGTSKSVRLPGPPQRGRTRFTAALMSMLDEDDEDESESSSNEGQHATDARPPRDGDLSQQEDGSTESDADDDAEGSNELPAPEAQVASDEAGAEQPADESNAVPAAAVAEEHDPTDPTRVLTREELLDFFTTAFNDVPRGVLGGPSADAARVKLREMRRKQRAAARAARQEELRRQQAIAERLIEVGLGAQLRYGQASDLMSLHGGSQKPSGASERGPVERDAGSQDDEEGGASDEDEEEDEEHHPLVIGMVGYPNVGKSSTINVLMGATSVNHAAKRVAVASTPGKTKHFQTLSLNADITLADCPGLVFPSFVASKEDMVVNGILPIDQLRDFVAPMRLLCQRVPRRHLEAAYGIKLPVPPPPQDPERQPTLYELLDTYCTARGFMASAHGGTDRPRGARALLKDFTEGRLTYCEAPPGGWTAWCAPEDAAALELFQVGGAAPTAADETLPAATGSAARSARATFADNVLLPSVVTHARRAVASAPTTDAAPFANEAVASHAAPSTTEALASHTVAAGSGDDFDEDMADEEEGELTDDGEELDEEVLRAFARKVTLREVVGMGDDVVEEVSDEEGLVSIEPEAAPGGGRSARGGINKYGRPVKPRRLRKGERHVEDPYGTAAVATAAARKAEEVEIAAANALRDRMLAGQAGGASARASAAVPGGLTTVSTTGARPGASTGPSRGGGKRVLGGSGGGVIKDALPAGVRGLVPGAGKAAK